MDNELASNETNTVASSRGMTRRSVVRTGGHLAWAVPAVTLVTAAPALAASGDKPVLKIHGFDAHYSDGKSGVRVGFDEVKAGRSGGDPGQLTAVVTLPVKEKGPFKKAPTYVDNGGPWSFAGRDGDGPWTFTFVSNKTVEAGTTSGALNASFDLKGGKKKTPDATVSVTVIGADGGSDSASATI